MKIYININVKALLNQTSKDIYKTQKTQREKNTHDNLTNIAEKKEENEKQNSIQKTHTQTMNI